MFFCSDIILRLKSDAQAAKAAETARKRAERAEQLAEEEASLPSKPKGAGSKTSQKKSRGLDLSGLDAPSSLSKNALNATGINNALDALSLTSGSAASQKVDRHPERRYKAAYAAFEERRLQDMAEDKSLRRPQKLNQIRKEFEKHPDNPFNQTSASFNASPQEISDIRNQEAEKIEKRLASGK